MIQEANVGVGIQGQEGMQAVMSSDYAIAQFKYLNRLLLVHGRWSYFRTAEMFLLMFYKNMVWAMVLFWFQIYSCWSSQILYDYIFVLFYNLVYTSLPPLVLGVFDQDILPEFALAAPQLYMTGIKQELYGSALFLLYMLDGLYQSLVVFYFSMAAFGEFPVNAEGYSTNISQFGTLAATMAVTSANIYMGLCFHRWTWITHFVVWGSPIVFMLFVIIYSYLPGSTLSGVVVDQFGQGTFWLSLIVGVIMCLLPRFILKAFLTQWRPRDTDIIKEIEKYKLESEWKQARWKDASEDASLTMKGPAPSPSLALKTKQKIEKFVSDTVRGLKPHLKRARMLLMKNENYESNTGYAFSQEPGIKEHLGTIEATGSLQRPKKKDNTRRVSVVFEDPKTSTDSKQ
jgi:magnesium-transporting ATPase (P-type)